MRLPVDRARVALTLETGEALTGDIFLAPSEPVSSVLQHHEPFMPLGLDKHVRLVARATIACLAVAIATDRDPDVAEETQRVRVRLKSGATIEGDLRWVALVGHRRTVDHLNLPARFLAIHAPGTTTYVLKPHVAWVEEC